MNCLLLWFRYRRDLWHIGSERRRIRNRCARAYRRSLREKRSSDALFAIIAERLDEMARLDDERSEALSIYLRERANALGLPTPDLHDTALWEISHKTGMRRLNKNALAALQVTIRNEKKQRLAVWEQRTKIFSPAVTALTGLIGALIGFLTIAHLHR